MTLNLQIKITQKEEIRLLMQFPFIPSDCFLSMIKWVSMYFWIPVFLILRTQWGKTTLKEGCHSLLKTEGAMQKLGGKNA